MLTALALLLLAQEPPPADPAPTPAVDEGNAGDARVDLEPLEGAALELSHLLCGRSPWLALERGIPRHEKSAVYGDFGSRGGSDRRRRLEGLEREIELVADRANDAEFRAERDALVAAVELEAILSDPWRAERWNPLEWVARVERVLRLQVAVAPDERVFAELLAELPGVFEEAERSLEPSPDPWRADAIGRLAKLEELVGSLELGADPERDALRARAVEACRRFGRSLAARSGAEARHPPALGEARWLELLGAAAGFAGTLEALESSLLGDLARLEREHGGLAALGTEPSGSGADREPPDASDPSIEDLALEAARAAWKARFVPIFGDIAPPAFTVRTDDLPALLGRDAVFLARSAERAELLLAPASLARSDELALRRAVLRRGIPGEALLCESPLRGTRAAPRYLWNRALVEGWGWLALAAAGAEDPLSAGAACELELETLRLLATLDVHARGLSLGRAAERLARRGGLGEERSLAEARRALDDPLNGIGVLGRRELVRVRDSAPDERAFLELVLSHPHFRPTDLAALAPAAATGK
jgi:hypothetical protein